VRVGTRGSALARAQTALAFAALSAVYPSLIMEEVIIRTTGDRQTSAPLAALASGASGVFTSALEQALLAGEIDLAVHSAKDLPIALTPGLVLVAHLPRADARDVLISRDGHTLATLPRGAVIGTSSPRRAAQLRAARPDVNIHDLRGNIDTRLGRALDPASGYHAIVLARAGLERLHRADAIAETLSLDVMLPAPGQGAIALQTRDEPIWRALIAPLDDPATSEAVIAERAFLHGLGGGCALPVGAYAEVEEHDLRLHGRVLSHDGARRVDVAAVFSRAQGADHAGGALAARALYLGGQALIAEETS
jgi:hydroxymethylbilane synthase